MKGKRFTHVKVTHFNDCSDCPHRRFYGDDNDVDHDRCEKLNTYIRCYLNTGIEDYTNEDGVLKDCPYLKNYGDNDNLQKAAEEYAKQHRNSLGYTSEEHIDGFVAGAEWLASQCETHEATVLENYDGALIEEIYLDKFKKGDKVIVQIRKA